MCQEPSECIKLLKKIETVKCFTVKYNTRKNDTNFIQDQNVFLHMLTRDENVEDVTAYFSMVVCATSQLVFIVFFYEFYFLVLKTTL